MMLLEVACGHRPKTGEAATIHHLKDKKKFIVSQDTKKRFTHGTIKNRPPQSAKILIAFF